MQIALLVAEAGLAGGLVLFLFWLRPRIGLAPLYLVVGAFQYLQLVLATAVQVEVAASLTVSPGAVVYFPLTIVVVLLTYIEEDAVETRKVAYGVVIANLAIYVLSQIARQHLDLDGVDGTPILPVEFGENGRVAIASATALFIDVVSTVVIFEQVSTWVRRSLFMRLWICLVSIMALDSLLFTTGAFLGRPAFTSLLVSSFVGKAVGATFYAVIVALYASYVETPGRRRFDLPRGDDVFDWLTYRQRYEHARTMMTRDALTGLFNRGYFDETAPRHLAHANRAGHQMSLVMIDVDRLKDTNDRHGHQAGDALLTFVARQVEQMVRSADVACRYGGDEFIVVLTTADGRAAQIFSERLLDLVKTKSMEHVPTPKWAPATITIGVAVYPDDGLTLPDLVLRADEQLYAGKRQGGGRLVTSISAERR